MRTNMLEIKKLTKQFGKKIAVDNISLKLNDNKIYGLLGSNGAGKTTIMKIIANRSFPTSGEIIVDGENVSENEIVQKEIFYVNENDKYSKDMKLKDILKWEARFFDKFDLEYAKSLAKKFELNLEQKIGALSTGYYTIFKVIISLASNTKIMILDEPVLGIDSLYRELFYKILLNHHKKNKNLILIATHLIDEVEPVLEEVIIIDKGHILKQIKKDELTIGKSLNQAYVDILKETRHG